MAFRESHVLLITLQSEAFKGLAAVPDSNAVDAGESLVRCWESAICEY